MRILGIDNKIIYFFQRDLQAWNMAHNLLKNQIKRKKIFCWNLGITILHLECTKYS